MIPTPRSLRSAGNVLTLLVPQDWFSPDPLVLFQCEVTDGDVTFL